GSSSVDSGTDTTPVTLGTITTGTTPAFVIDGQAVNVAFPVPAGAAIDPTSLVGCRQLTLGGAGLGSVTIDQTYTPHLSADGTTVTYRLAGTLATSGAVTAS